MYAIEIAGSRMNAASRGSRLEQDQLAPVRVAGGQGRLQGAWVVSVAERGADRPRPTACPPGVGRPAVVPASRAAPPGHLGEVGGLAARIQVQRPHAGGL